MQRRRAGPLSQAAQNVAALEVEVEDLRVASREGGPNPNRAQPSLLSAARLSCARGGAVTGGPPARGRRSVTYQYLSLPLCTPKAKQHKAALTAAARGRGAA